MISPNKSPEKGRYGGTDRPPGSSKSNPKKLYVVVGKSIGKKRKRSKMEAKYAGRKAGKQQLKMETTRSSAHSNPTRNNGNKE